MKRKILKILSSCLGVLAICGFSLLFCFDDKKNTQKVSAYEVNDLYHTNWSLVTEVNNTNNTKFDNTWGVFHSFMRPSADYPSNRSNPYISWSYDFDYYITGYVNTTYFEMIRIRVSYLYSEGLMEEFDIGFYADTIYNFNLSNLNQYGLMAKWGYYSRGFSPDYSKTYGCSYSDSVFSFIDGSDKINNHLLFFLNTLGVFTGGNDFTDENIQISQYEDTIAQLQDRIDILEEQLLQAENQSTTSWLDGYSSGYATAESDLQSTISSTYQDGYNDGYNDGFSTDSTVSTIFSNILLVGMLPVNFFLSILNWEFLGINIGAFVSALLSVAATIIVLRIVVGSKNG